MPDEDKWLAGEEFLRTGEPVFSFLMEKYGHCTLSALPPEKYYATLLKGVLAQQVAEDVGHKLFLSFSARYGEQPAPQDILASPAADFKACGIIEPKISYIRDLSRHILEKKIDLGQFPKLDDNTIVKQLSGIKGLGRWTAEIFLILALNRQDVLPADDFGLKKAMKDLFGLSALPQKRSQVTAVAEAWRPWRSLAAWYLWQSFADGNKLTVK
jgi:DNA-3-methyladenine glycosylase II